MTPFPFCAKTGLNRKEFLMLENLLHAQIVLSQEDIAKLSNAGMKDVPSTHDGVIGTITFLGVNHAIRNRVYLLLRFEYGRHDNAMMTTVIENPPAPLN